VKVTCSTCHIPLNLPDEKVPVGRSYVVCPRCGSRINIFMSVRPGAVVTNLTGLRFLANNDDLEDRFCDPGELWRVLEVVEPCPDRGKGRACEKENRGRCPNQRLVIRLRGDKIRYKTCLYRQGRRIFDKNRRPPVGDRPLSSGSDPRK
jgi:DNA-directed RNA polymerase subunit RPC12/RpoP